MKRSLLIQIAIVVVLAVAAFFVLRQPGETSTSGVSDRMLVTFDSSTVDKVDIRSGTGSVTLQREGVQWMMVSPLRYPANEAAIKEALEKAGHIRLENVASSNPQKQSVYQVDSTGTLVRLYEGGKETAAFIVGKMGSSYTETFVRKEKSNDVYSASGTLGYVFSKPVKEWRNMEIFKADQAALRNIRFQYGDTTFALSNADSVWRVDRDSASPSAVRSFLAALSNFQADDFVDSTVSSIPKLTASIDADGVQLRFFREKEGTKYFVQSSQTTQLFEVLNWKVLQLLKKKKDFLAKPA